MKKIDWKLCKEQNCGIVKDDVYGGFVEHLGRNVYGGVYDPGSPAADEDGFRKDVLELVRNLDMPITRYPGGCYVDFERWEDGIGPERKGRIDPAWYQLEPHTFGLNEFMKWTRKANTKPLMTINVSCRTLIDTLNIYEYCNFPGGTWWSDLRRSHGYEEPWNVKNWCIGNELYGNWEMGQMSAEEYGRIAREHAKTLKKVDPDCRIIVSGMPRDLEWNKTVLDICGRFVDVLSIHDSFRPQKHTDQYLKTVDAFEDDLSAVIRICQGYSAMLNRRISVSVDEWIIWDFNRRMRDGEKWTVGPHLLEQDYNIQESLIAGSLFSLFHRHASDIDIACIAQSVNVIAPIRTEPDGTSWKQTLYYPFELTSRYGRGLSLVPEETGNEDKDLYGSAVFNEERNETALFLINRSGEKVQFSAACPGAAGVADSVTMFSEDLTAVNGPGCDRIHPVPLQTAFDGAVSAELPPYSWSMIRVKLG